MIVPKGIAPKGTKTYTTMVASDNLETDILEVVIFLLRSSFIGNRAAQRIHIWTARRND